MPVKQMTQDEARRKVALGKSLLGQDYLPKEMPPLAPDMEVPEASSFTPPPELAPQPMPQMSATAQGGLEQAAQGSMIPRGMKPPNSADKYKSFLDEGAPLPSDFQPSGKRKFMSILAGIGAGIAGGGVTGGIQAGRYIQQGPYRQAMQERNARGTGLAELAKFEEGQKASESQQELRGYQGKAFQAEAEKDAAQKHNFEWQTSPEGLSHQERMTRLAHPGPAVKPTTQKPVRIQTLDGKRYIGTMDDQGKMYVNGSPLDPTTIKDFDVSTAGPSHSNHDKYSQYRQMWNADPANAGKQWTMADEQQMYKFIDDPNNLEAGRLRNQTAAVGSLMNQRSILNGFGGGGMPGTTPPFVPTAGPISQPPGGAPAAQPPNPAGETQSQPAGSVVSPHMQRVYSMYNSPDEFHNYTKEQKAIVGPMWTEMTGLPLPSKLGSSEGTQETFSRITQTHTKLIRDLMKDPDVNARFGTFNGSLDQFLTSIGSGALNASPEVKQKVAQYISNTAYLKGQEGRVMAGSRTAKDIRDMLTNISPAMKGDYNVQLGQLDAIDANADMTLEGIDQQRFGGKSRKKARIPKGYDDWTKSKSPSESSPTKSFAQELIDLLPSRRKKGSE